MHPPYHLRDNKVWKTIFKMKHYPLLVSNENPPNRLWNTVFPNKLVAYTLYSLQFSKKNNLIASYCESKNARPSFSSSLLFHLLWNSPSTQGMMITLHRLRFVLRCWGSFLLFVWYSVFIYFRHLDLVSNQKTLLTRITFRVQSY